jgi:hypothetical protein
MGIVKHLRAFSLRSRQFGPGAWEVFARYEFMDVGSHFVVYGRASSDGSANRVWQTDAGITWHVTTTKGLATEVSTAIVRVRRSTSQTRRQPAAKYSLTFRAISLAVPPWTAGQSRDTSPVRAAAGIVRRARFRVLLGRRAQQPGQFGGCV